MEITPLGKEILIAIGPDEIALTQLRNKVKNELVGAELPLLQNFGLLEEVDGYVCLTDAGVKAAVIIIDGKEIPEDFMSTFVKQRNIKIDKPGDAISRYSNEGRVPKPLSEAVKKYRSGIERMRNNPTMQSAEENKEPELKEIEIAGTINCPIFGKTKQRFCENFCAAWDNTCSMTQKMIERLGLLCLL